jgi:hypothetical protein
VIRQSKPIIIWSTPVGRPEIRIRMIHVRKIVTLIVEDDRFKRIIDDETVAVVPRTAREAHRYKAYAVHKPLGRVKDL